MLDQWKFKKSEKKFSNEIYLNYLIDNILNREINIINGRNKNFKNVAFEFEEKQDIQNENNKFELIVISLNWFENLRIPLS